MDRGPSSLLLSWLLVPVAAVLVMSALTLPRQAYTGLVLRDARVVQVIEGSPGDRAGFRPGDRLHDPAAGAAQSQLLRGPLSRATPGRPLTLERTHDGTHERVWLIPDPLPDGERRMMAIYLAVASGFVLLGGWVWSQRRDPLTRTFFLLCLSLAWLFAPARPWTSMTPAIVDAVFLTVLSTFLPALFVDFFASFPEARAQGRRTGWVSTAYLLSSILVVPSLALLVLEARGNQTAPVIIDLVQGVAGAWFAIGLLVALALFAASYRRAGSTDARRRLRVALIGTLVGVLPLAALIALRNISPGTTVTGERWSVVLTLLVAASFAWATVVHQVFDFRVALRAVAVTVQLALVAVVVYATGEWLGALWWHDLGRGIAGWALAFVALTAALAGPASQWLGTLAARMVPGNELSLAGWFSSAADPASSEPPHDQAATLESLLGRACEAVCRTLRLDGCLGLIIDGDDVSPVRPRHAKALPEPGPELRLRATHLAFRGVQSLDTAPLDEADREALALAGVGWVLPVGTEPVRAVLLLGRRLAGAWLSRSETSELERFAAHLAVMLENQTLRSEATSHGVLERELREAGVIQARLLPRQAPVYPTLDCAAAALSCEAVGGDYYDFVEGPGRDFTLAVGDAAGHGVPAALLMAQVQSRFRSEARRGLTPGQLLRDLNRELVVLDQPEKFVGLLCARVDVRTARIWIANGGLTPPLVRRADGRSLEVVAGGVLLGVSAEASYPDACVDLGAGDIVVVYTDGLTEARRGDELFGVERVCEVLDRTARRRATDILDTLLSEVRAWADQPLDDMTVVVLKQLTEPARIRPSLARNALKWQTASADAMD